MQTAFLRLRWIALFAALIGGSAPVQAQRHQGGSARGGYNHHFHGRDFGHFSPAERGVWRNGRWAHGWHDGRFAWWWAAGGGWYSYPAPQYPYPTYVPPAIVVQQPLIVPMGPPPAQFWYFCESPKGYYPYVAACNATWREVPASPK